MLSRRLYNFFIVTSSCNICDAIIKQTKKFSETLRSFTQCDYAFTLTALIDVCCINIGRRSPVVSSPLIRVFHCKS